MLGKLKIAAKGARNLAADAAHTVVGDVGRSATHKLNNFIGSDRDLYRRPKKFTLSDDDVRRYIELEVRTKDELLRAQIGYQALSNAISNRGNTDGLYMQAALQAGKVRATLEGQQLHHELAMSQVQSQLNGTRREIAATIAADAQAERMQTMQAWQTVEAHVHATQAQGNQTQWSNEA